MEQSILKMDKKEKKEILRRLHSSIDVKSFLAYTSYLEAVYQELKKSIPKFSHKKYAEFLGFSASNITIEYIHGRRPLSIKAGKKIIESFNFRAIDKKYFNILIQYQNSENENEKGDLLAKIIDLKENDDFVLDTDQFKFFRNWLNVVMLEAIQLSSFNLDFKNLTKNFKFKVSPKQAFESFSFLRSLNLFKVNLNGKIELNEKNALSTGHKVSGVSLNKFHSDMISHGKKALNEMKNDERDISALTMCMDEKSYKKIREMIHEFQIKVLQESEKSCKKDRVYQMNIQYFPFIKLNEDKDDA